MDNHAPETKPAQDKPPDSSPARSARRARRLIAAIVGLSLLAAAAFVNRRVILPARGYVAYTVPSDGMLPTLSGGDRPADTIRVNLRAYQATDPARCELVVFEHPFQPETHLISRIAGMPGEAISIRNGETCIGDQSTQIASSEGPITYTNAGCLGPGEKLRIPDDSYFMLSDNSAVAIDSRFFGPVPRVNLIGRVEKITWPPNRIRSLLPAQ